MLFWGSFSFIIKPMRANLPIERSIPLLFLLITIVAYGLLLPFTGFYWDDWPFAWIAKFFGPQEFIPAFAGVRPFLGPIFFVTTSLIPPVPLYWQIFALLIRVLSGLSAWFTLNQVWPHHKRQTLIASLLFLVFPGYSQHWVAFTHINQEWIPFIFYLLSFGFTGRALRNPDKFPSNTIYALLFLIAGVFPTEYFVSIEPLRFFFIWVILSEKITGFGARCFQAFKIWIPYFLIWLANAAWLAYFYTIGEYESYEVEVVKEPLTFLRILSTIGEAIWKAGFYVWGQVIVLVSKSIFAPANLVTLTLIFLAFILIFFYFTRFGLPEGTTKTFAVPAILIGLLGILLGRIPSFAAGLPLTLQSSYDRFMISMMLGGSLFITGLIELLLRNSRVKTYAFALLIALGIGQQFFNANIFRRDWTKQQEIYWQLAWRIPALKPNTALLTDQMPIDYETDLSFTAPLNWMYAPGYEPSMASGATSQVAIWAAPPAFDSDSVDEKKNVPYALFYTEKRLGGASLPSLEPNTKISLPIRRVSFEGSTSQALVIYMPKNGCLRVLSPKRGDEITYGKQSPFLVNAIPLSDPTNIILESQQIAKIPFLSEPKHTWCYYFAKAELAYQQEDWKKVVDLINEAKSFGYGPEDPFEWLTYIEAQAFTGNLEAAQKASKNAFEQENGIRKGVCEVWKRVQAQSGLEHEKQMRVIQILSEFQCAQ